MFYRARFYYMTIGAIIMGFVHLNVHTGYSLQSGACRIAPLVKKAKELGHTALAITDSGALYGAVDFFDACRREGIKAIIGCGLSIAEDSRLSPRRAGFEPYKLTVLCKNEIGYKNLCRLIAEQRSVGISGEFLTDMASIAEHSEGLIALSGAVGGEVQRRLAENRAEEAQRAAERYQKIFGGDFFLEISNHNTAEESRLCTRIREFSEKTGIPAVPVNNVHYVEKSESGVQRILSCIGHNKKLSESDPRALPTDEYYLKSAEEMCRFFTEEELSRTVGIAARCGFEFEFGVTKLPLFTKENVSDNTQYLRNMCAKGAQKRYGTITPQITERLEYELNIIGTMGFVDYFLIVWDFVRFAKSSGIPVGPGRGSGAASLCAYCLGITDIDPLKYELLFERFLNPERVSMPDFDIDFCNERRGEVIEYVKRRYGSDHVAQIIAFDTLKSKAALRDAARVLGISPGAADAAAKAVSSFSTLSEELDHGELKKLYASDAEIRRLTDAAMKIEGFPRHTTIHAAGVVITRDPAAEYVPLQFEEGGFTAQYTMTALERLGLLKMDFLGLKNLTTIRKTCDLIRQSSPEFDIRRIDERDPEVYKMLSGGGTCGVFQFESAGMTSVLTRLKPQSIEDLTAAIALYRPGPMSSIPTYIANRHKDPEKIEYKHPLLKDILGVTYGCIVYQEQVMQICRVIGGYSYGRADLVRRAMSKKKHEEMERERGAFIYGTDSNPGAIANGVPEKTANEIFDEMSGFASYAFNKAHAAAYATVAYQTAYLRCHYYAEYMAAMMSAQPEKLIEYIADLSDNKTRLLPPDVNRSSSDFTTEDGAVRFGLAAVKGVGRSFADQISQERENGAFFSVSDFAVRMAAYDNNRRYMEALIRCGAFDTFPQNRRELLDSMDALLEYASREFSRKESGQLDLFEQASGGATEFTFPKRENLNKMQLLNMEKEYLGAYISGHPADAYLPRAADDCVYAADLERLDAGAQVSVIALMTRSSPHVDKKGNTMAFLELEDSSGETECVMFSDLYGRVGKPAVGDVYCIRGRISAKGNKKSLTAANIVRAETLPEQPRKTLYLNFSSASDPRITEAVKLLSEFRGISSAKICFADTREVRTAAAPNRSGLRGVRICPKLIQELKKLLGDNNVATK